MLAGQLWTWLSHYGGLFDERDDGLLCRQRWRSVHPVALLSGEVMDYLYGRVSTDDQSLSAHNQRQVLEDYAVRNGLDVGGVFIDEDVSGKTPIRSRPEGGRMTELLREGDRVVMTKLDRGFRDTIDALVTIRDFRAAGVEFVFLDLGIDTSTPMGWQMLAFFAAGAEAERARIAERVRDAWSYLRRNNKPYACARPWGWVRKGKGRDGEWVPCHEERAVAETVIKMREAGMTWEKIACKLCARGVEKPIFRRTARPVYYSADVRALALAAADGYPTQRPVRQRASGRVRLRPSVACHDPGQVCAG